MSMSCCVFSNRHLADTDAWQRGLDALGFALRFTIDDNCPITDLSGHLPATWEGHDFAWPIEPVMSWVGFPPGCRTTMLQGSRGVRWYLGQAGVSRPASKSIKVSGFAETADGSTQESATEIAASEPLTNKVMLLRSA